MGTNAGRIYAARVIGADYLVPPKLPKSTNMGVVLKTPGLGRNWV